MTVDAPTRTLAPVAPARSRGHVHDRTCFWDVFTCRWAGPAHPDLAASVPAPRRPPEAQRGA